MTRSNSFLSLTGVLLITLLSGCAGRHEQADGGKVFRYNEAADITSLDPAFARDQANIWAVNQLFNGLVQLNDNLEVIPCISSRWDISEDGRAYTFHLRSDVFFHDDPCFPGGKGRRVTGRFHFQLPAPPRPGNRLAGGLGVRVAGWQRTLYRRERLHAGHPAEKDLPAFPRDFDNPVLLGGP
jgi:hypothetical protein